MTAYQQKSEKIPPFTDGNFYSDNPYEVESFMRLARRQEKLCEGTDASATWRDLKKGARKWLSKHFTKV